MDLFTFACVWDPTLKSQISFQSHKCSGNLNFGHLLLSVLFSSIVQWQFQSLIFLFFKCLEPGEESKVQELSFCLPSSRGPFTPNTFALPKIWSIGNLCSLHLITWFLVFFSNPVLKTITGGFWKFPISCQVKDLNKNSSYFFFIEMNLIFILTDQLCPNTYFSFWFLVFISYLLNCLSNRYFHWTFIPPACLSYLHMCLLLLFDLPPPGPESICSPLTQTCFLQD